MYIEHPHRLSFSSKGSDGLDGIGDLVDVTGGFRSGYRGDVLVSFQHGDIEPSLSEKQVSGCPVDETEEHTEKNKMRIGGRQTSAIFQSMIRPIKILPSKLVIEMRTCALTSPVAAPTLAGWDDTADVRPPADESS